MKVITLVVVVFQVVLGLSSAELCSMHRSTRDAKRTGNYLIQLHDNVTESGFNSTLERAVKLSQNKRVYVVVRTIEKGFALMINRYVAQQICHWPEVKSVEEETEAVGAQDQSLVWHLDHLDQIIATNSTRDYQYQPVGTGYGIDAYVLDSGVKYSHQEFENRAKYSGYDPVDQYYSQYNWKLRHGNDCHGHGTHVASLLGGAQYGAAKRVTLFSVRVLNCFNAAPWSVVLDGMDHVVKMVLKRKRPSIVSMSLGGNHQPMVNEAVKRLVDLGVVVIVAAGNDNSDSCQFSPSGSPYAITVGGTNSSSALYWATNYGSCVNIFAPGVSILSADKECDNCTKFLSGTSMATPLVSGVAAILLEKQPLLKPSELKELLKETALKNSLDFGLLVNDEQLAGTPNHFLNIMGSCGGIYSVQNSHSISSPNYPGDYPPNVDCEWKLLAKRGEEDIAITITDVDLQDGYDYLLVCEGDGVCDVGHSNATRYTGQIQHAEGGAINEIYHRALNANITLRLVTDDINNKRGFILNYTKYYTKTPLKVLDPDEVTIKKVDHSLPKAKTQTFIKIPPSEILVLTKEWKNNGYDILSVSTCQGIDGEWYYNVIYHNSSVMQSVGYVELNSTELNQTIYKQKLSGLTINTLTARLNGTTPFYSVTFRKEHSLIEGHAYWDTPVSAHILTRLKMENKGWDMISQHFLTGPGISRVSAVYQRDKRTIYNITVPNDPEWSVYYGFPFYYFSAVTLDFLHHGYYTKHVSTYRYGNEAQSRFSVIYEAKRKENDHVTYFRWIRWGLNSSQVYDEIKYFNPHWDPVLITGYVYRNELLYLMEWGLKIGN